MIVDILLFPLNLIYSESLSFLKEVMSFLFFPENVYFFQRTNIGACMVYAGIVA